MIMLHHATEKEKERSTFPFKLTPLLSFETVAFFWKRRDYGAGWSSQQRVTCHVVIGAVETARLFKTTSVAPTLQL